MLLLQPVLEFMHLLQSAFYYVLATSYFIGRNIFMILLRIGGFVRDLLAAIVIIGEELYNFIGELEASLSAVARYVHSCTNISINCCLDAVGIFCHKMVQFFTSTRMSSRLLATKTGSCIFDCLSLLRGALLLIADCIWWLLTILPITLITVLIAVGDALVFGIHALSEGMLYTVNVLVDDFFRLTIGAAVFCVLWGNARHLIAVMVRFVQRIKTLLHLTMQTARLQWQSLQRRIYGRNAVSSPSTVAVRRTALPRGTHSPTSVAEKLLDSQRCVVCRDRVKCVLLLPCKHLCLCEECADYMIFSAQTHHCPLCRSQVVHSMSVYI